MNTLPEAERQPAIRAMLTASRKDGSGPLFMAARNGHTEAVQCLVAASEQAVNILPEAERYPAIRAMLTAFREDGAGPLFIAARNGHIIAARNGHTGVVQCLVTALEKAVTTLPEAEKQPTIRAMLTAPRKDTCLFITNIRNSALLPGFDNVATLKPLVNRGSKF